MNYFHFQPIKEFLELAESYSALALENGCDRKTAGAKYEKLMQAVKDALEDFRTLEKESAASSREPNDYAEILACCEGGNTMQPVSNFPSRVAGALIGRFAGCILGAPVEAWDIYNMEHLAKNCGMPFPPTDYWTEVERPWGLQFERDLRSRYTRGGMDGVPVDDDITYTILALLILEKYGPDFTTEQVGEYWLNHLPTACTAELAALNNLKKGIPANQAAEHDNPYSQWIGALIRADGFGYACAGNPHLAAKMGYTDAHLTHRRNGIYGEMLFAAAIAAAFFVKDPLDAIRIGLREIPAGSSLYEDVTWALETAPSITDYLAARKAVDMRFAGMHVVHTNNNACLNVFALHLGQCDLTKTISTAVAMGLDNDCTAATCGSIVGAIQGCDNLPAHWSAPFHDRVRTYIIGAEELSFADVVDRFVTLQKHFAKPTETGRSPSSAAS